MAKRLPQFEMRFEPMTIEHLGLRLYSTLPPVICEFVSNAYDAESPKVEINLPPGAITSRSEVVIRDFGHGMTPEELNDEFLPIGRNRRGRDSSDCMSKNGKRRVTGRKGLGKLSAFGVAREMEARSINDGYAVCLRLDYDEMMRWAETQRSEPYRPEVVEDRTGQADEKDGVEITLRRFHRKAPISADTVRKGLAKRLLFIGTNFRVLVNGEEIQPGDRLSRDACSVSWDVADLPMGAEISNCGSLEGWIGFLDKSSQADRGVDVFASGKAVELASYFHYASTHAQFARAHLVGEIRADFLDAPEQDLIATARNSVVWESIAGQALGDWGQGALRWAFGQWLAQRRERKQKEITVETGFAKWLETREPREKKVANRMVKILIDNEDLQASSAKPLLEIVKSSVETVAFHELVDEIETKGGTPATLLRLFGEWQIIEAREHLKLAHGRLEALDKLERFIREGALEVTEMQPLLAENPWIIDPAWTETHIEETYSELIRKNCKENRDLPVKERRVDIWGVKAGATVTVVELKHPQKTLSWKDLDQIEKYVRWARSRIQGSGPHAPRYINGLLVIGSQSRARDVTDKRRSLAGEDIRVETYRDLHVAARGFYNEVDRQLQALAPEYSRLKKKERAASKSKPKKASKKKKTSRRKRA